MSRSPAASTVFTQDSGRRGASASRHGASQSGTVHHSENPFRSGSRDNAPAFEDCFAGVAAAERFMAFSDSLHAISPPQNWRQASVAAAGSPSRDANFTVRSLSSSQGDDGGAVGLSPIRRVASHPPARIERSPDSVAASPRPNLEDTPGHKGTMGTPILSPMGGGLGAPATPLMAHHRLPSDRTPSARAPAAIALAVESEAELVDRLAREISAHVATLLARDQAMARNYGRSTVPPHDAVADVLDDFFSSGDFTYYRPRARWVASSHVSSDKAMNAMLATPQGTRAFGYGDLYHYPLC